MAIENMTAKPVDPLVASAAIKGSRPPLSGWLLKQKSDGSKSRIFSSTNRRYFTVDFGNQIVYYSHSEGNKKVSVPIPFRDIIGVQPLVGSVNDGSEGVGDEQPKLSVPAPQRSDSKGSLATIRSRMPSFGSLSKKSTERHGFVLETVGKTMELLCASMAEAEQWIAAINDAMGQVGEKSGDACGDWCDTSTVAGSTSPELSVAPSSNSARSIESFSETTVKCKSPRPLAQDSGPEAASVPAPAGDGLSQEKRRTFGLRPPKLPGKAKKASSPPEAPQKATSPDSKPQPSLGPRDSGSASESALDEGSRSCGAWDAAQTYESSKASRYADKGQGLSVQERLQQLEFSDDEDEDDETEKACGIQHGVAAHAALAESQKIDTSPVTVEQCEPFHAPDCSEDEGN